MNDMKQILLLLVLSTFISGLSSQERTYERDTLWWGSSIKYIGYRLFPYRLNAEIADSISKESDLITILQAHDTLIAIKKMTPADSDIPHFNFKEIQLSQLEDYAKKNGFTISREGEDYYCTQEEEDSHDGDCGCGYFSTGIENEKDTINYMDYDENRVEFTDARIGSAAYKVAGLRVGMKLSEISWLNAAVPDLAGINYLIIDSETLLEDGLWRGKGFSQPVLEYRYKIVVYIEKEKIKQLDYFYTPVF